MRINYQNILEDTLSNITKSGEKPSLLLHSCCAPCSSYVLNYLVNFFKISVIYYNPNIYPQSEYFKRYFEQKKLINILNNKIQIIECEYYPNDYYEAIKGYELLKEGSERCFRCYELRLRKTAIIAKETNFDYFGTTLSVSPMKNAEKLNAIGKQLEETYKVKYLFSDFKKKEGYKQSILLAKKYDLYRQSYCGCSYSATEHQLSKTTIEDSTPSITI